MNDGTVCMSVQASTVDQFIERIESATGNSDLIELRFDYLEPDELAANDVDKLNEVVARILGAASGIPCITTFRPKEFGGRRVISDRERSNFWNLGSETEIADLEEDLVDRLRLRAKRICSFHDFDRVPRDIDVIFERLACTGVEIVKIAAQVQDATDAIPIWKLLERSEIGLIPIAMGEAGKWTRILGLAHGSPITYASQEVVQATAPGQFTATDLIEVYRVKELDRETSIHGIVAGDTSYSLSPYMQNAAFQTAGLNAVFVPFQVRDLEAFVSRMIRRPSREVDLNIHGLSVTNPHKQRIIPLLDEIDRTARAIGAVNTVKVDGDKLLGSNTDAEGFLKPLLRRLGDVKDARAAIVGAGGAARACVYALKEAGAHVTLFARDAARAAAVAKEFGVQAGQLRRDGVQDFPCEILVNATPLGTRGETETETIATGQELRGVKLVYDLVYNPSETRLMREARLAGVESIGGLDMLVEQGAKQFEIWTGIEAAPDVMRNAVQKRLK